LKLKKIIVFAFLVTMMSMMGMLSFELQAQDVTPVPGETVTPGPTPTSPIPTTPIPRPLPVTVVTQNGVTLELYFDSLAQGEVGLIHIYGDNITGARSRFLDKLVEFFAVEDEGFFGLLAVDIEQSARTYDLTVYASYPDESRETLTTEVEVTVGDFIRQDIQIAPDRAYLIDPQVERNEFARLESLASEFTTVRSWTGSTLRLPLNSNITSPFGAFRTLNGTAQTRHTGWDMRAPTGMPVMAMSSGVVAFAGLMDIRGNFVIVNHGYGVFSGYAHLSQIHVTRGQEVEAGMILGVSGDTGRSNGPHLHWELMVNGEFVDSVRFMQIWLP
jgi:murein DD-endopeptidase MepM/ murein hydrolase activator NlpD